MRRSNELLISEGKQPSRLGAFVLIVCLFNGYGWATARQAWAASLAAISKVHNVVDYRVANRDEWGPAVAGTPIYTGDWTKTGSMSQAEITYHDGSVLRLASSCTLQHLDPENHVLQLLLGKLWAKVIKGGRGLRVKMPAAIAAVTGTEFIVEVLPDQSTHLTVLEGTVLLFPPNVSNATIDQSIQNAGHQPAPAAGSQGQPSAAPARQQELNEPTAVGGNGQQQPAETSTAPIQVAAGQGAIARPDVSLHPAFAVDLGTVREEEGSILPPSSAMMTPTVNLTPVVVPRTPAVTQSTIQLQTTTNDPKVLQGSPTTGGIRVIIK